MGILEHPFTIGLIVGLVVTLVVWIKGLLERQSFNRETKRLKEHLHTQMEINAKGNERNENELETLRKQNENLRITVATLKNKPGRAELNMLHIYDEAIRKMHAQAPGFAPAWENALRESEARVQQTETGFLPLIRKTFKPSVYLPTLGKSRTEPVETPTPQGESETTDTPHPSGE